MGLLILQCFVGGALATLFHARLSRYPKDLEEATLTATYTFGSPRVGDKEFSKSFEQNHYAPVFRVYNHGDPVVKCLFGWDTRMLPSPRIFYFDSFDIRNNYGYRHVGTPFGIPPYYLQNIFALLEPIRSTNEYVCILLNVVCFMLTVVYIYFASLCKVYTANPLRATLWFFVLSPILILLSLPTILVVIPLYCHTPSAYVQLMEHWEPEFDLSEKW
jgi:hypothetical protein